MQHQLLPYTRWQDFIRKLTIQITHTQKQHGCINNKLFIYFSLLLFLPLFLALSQERSIGIGLPLFTERKEFPPEGEDGEVQCSHNHLGRVSWTLGNHFACRIGDERGTIEGHHALIAYAVDCRYKDAIDDPLRRDHLLPHGLRVETRKVGLRSYRCWVHQQLNPFELEKDVSVEKRQSAKITA